MSYIKGFLEGWIEELNKRNIVEFEYRDLPKELKDLSMIHRASRLRLIEKVRKVDNHIIWRVVKKIKPK